MEKATSAILSQRSMGTDDEREAAEQAGRLMTQLPLANIAKAKDSHAQDDFESAKSLRNMELWILPESIKPLKISASCTFSSSVRFFWLWS